MKTYRNVAGSLPELAKKSFIQPDGSRLPCALETFLLHKLGRIVTEIQITLLVASYSNWLFALFKLNLSLFNVTLSFNSTEKTWIVIVKTTELRTRLDMIVSASGCTFLEGEDKVENLHHAKG